VNNSVNHLNYKWATTSRVVGSSAVEEARSKITTSRRSGLGISELRHRLLRSRGHHTVKAICLFLSELSPRITPGDSIRVWAEKACYNKSWTLGETCVNPVYLAQSTTLACTVASPVRQVEKQQVLARSARKGERSIVCGLRWSSPGEPYGFDSWSPGTAWRILASPSRAASTSRSSAQDIVTSKPATRSRLLRRPERATRKRHG